MAKKSIQKKTASKKPIRRRKARGQGGSPFLPTVMVVLGILAVFKTGAAVLVAAGLVPTLVLAFTSKGAFKSEKLQCVAFANLTGILTQFPDVWARPNTAYDVVGEPINLLVMWGTAAFGYALIFVGPMVAAFILQMIAQERTKSIIQQKQGLVDLWSSEVLGTKDDVSPMAPASRFKK